MNERRWPYELGDTYLLGLVRAALGVFLFWNALTLAQEFLTQGYFGDVFHIPILPERLVPSRDIYAIVITARLLLAAMVTVGHRARFSLFASSLLAIYIALCDRIQLHHNRYALACYAFLLAFAPCDRSFRITARSTAASRMGPLWAARLVQLQLSVIYLASGMSKLVDPDWERGIVIADRIARHASTAIDRGVPPSVVAFFALPIVANGLAKLAIGTELFLAFGLWSKRTRIFALWWGVMFHLTIEVTSKVEIFTWLTLTIYALFATPDVAARKLYFDPSRPRAVVIARVIALLDWFARFEIRPWDPDSLEKAHVLVVVRRDGTHATGIRALAMFARTIPLLFPMWAPLALIASFTRRGETSAVA